MKPSYRIIGVIAFVVLILGLGFWLWSRSASAGRLVAERLSATIALPTQVEQVDWGLNGTTLREVSIQDADGEPLLNASQVAIPASALQLAFGATPQTLTVSHGQLIIRFDRSGQMLTTVPSGPAGAVSLPTIALDDVTLILRQEGRDDCVIHGISGDLRPGQQEDYVLEGTVSDSLWGEWSAQGTWSPVDDHASIQLRGSIVNATPELLDKVPFVPTDVWREVIPTGPMSGTISLVYEESQFSYHVTVETADASVAIPAIDLVARHVAGSMSVEDGMVRCQDLTAKTAEGQITVSGTLDTTIPEPEAELTLRADRLSVSQLPSSWELPTTLEGRLSGTARLTLTMGQDERKVRGEGQGTVKEAMLAGFPAEPIQLRLRATGSGIRFDTPMPPSAAMPVLVSSLVALAAPEDDAPYIDVNLGLKDVDLPEFLKRTGVTSPLSVTGKVSLQVTTSIPLRSPRDVAAYRAKGTIESDQLILEGIPLRQVRADILYRDSTLKLEKLSARLDGDPARGEPKDGFWEGSLTLGVVPPGDLSARLTLDHLPTSPLARLAPDLLVQVGGAVSGSLSFRAPEGKLRDIAAWSADAVLTSERIQALGLSATELQATAQLRAGVVKLSDLKATVEGTPIQGLAELRMSNDYPFSGRLEVEQADLTAINRLAPGFRPPFPVKGFLDAKLAIEGTLSPQRFSSSGTVTAKQLAIAQVVMEALSFGFEVGKENLRIQDLKASLYGGTVAGAATLPLAIDRLGKADLALADIDVGKLTRALPDFPIALGGTVSGSIQATLPGETDPEKMLVARVDLKGKRMSLQGVPAEEMTGTVNVSMGTAQYQLEGKALGGTFDLNGEVPLRKEPAKEGRLRIQGMQLGLIEEQVLPRGRRLGLTGRADLELDYQQAMTGISGSGRLRITQPRWAGQLLAPLLQANVRVDGERLRVFGVTAALGGGILRGDMTVFLGRTWSGGMRLRFDRVPPKLFLAAYPESAKQNTAPISGFLRIKLGSTMMARGFLALSPGRFLGYSIERARFPITAEYSLATGSGHVATHGATVNAANGRAQGDGDYHWGYESRAQAKIDFTNLDLRGLAPELTRGGYVGGQVTGRFTLAGSSIRSWDDLNGRLSARLRGTQALQLPILSTLAPFLGGGTATRFDEGDMQAVLNKGLWRIDRLALTSSLIRLYILGTVTTAGRLNLDVTAVTGQLTIDPRWLRLARISVPLTGPLPISLILEASQYLSNRTIRLDVTGTVSRPVVRVKVGALLRDEALRFLLNQSPVPLPVVPNSTP